jgi:hypothetical protein
MLLIFPEQVERSIVEDLLEETKNIQISRQLEVTKRRP